MKNSKVKVECELAEEIYDKLVVEATKRNVSVSDLLNHNLKLQLAEVINFEEGVRHLDKNLSTNNL